MARIKPHWHTQSVVRNPESGTRKNPFGPVVRHYEVYREVTYGTRREAQQKVSLSSNVIVRCENPGCGPEAREGAAR